MNLYEKNNHFK